MIFLALPAKPAVEFVMPRAGDGPESKALAKAFQDESLDFIKSSVIALPVRELARDGHPFIQAKKRFSVSVTIGEIRRGKALPSDPFDFDDETESS
jgi:hypothetical protein